ncbi:GntR family transcriptional regulator [Streptomyces sp. NPDC058572]|uniref:GntR family transcriptional regulator n=1 Tax=Streptomyces sp. NPDC058572 TaxID=3346546 RepID=UPI00365126BE
MRLPLEDDSRPPYIQAAEVLRREISTGRLKAGDKLPSARTLQDRYGIASSTVQNALRLLKSEGLIYSVQGRGSFVRNSTSGAPAGTTPDQSREQEAEPTDPTPDHTAESLAQDVAELKTAVKQLEETLSRLAAIVQAQQDR